MGPPPCRDFWEKDESPRVRQPTGIPDKKFISDNSGVTLNYILVFHIIWTRRINHRTLCVCVCVCVWEHLRSSFLATLKCIVQYYYYYFLNIYFIYFWLRWVFVAVRSLSLVAASGGYSSLRYAGFSLRWLLLLRSTGSRHGGFSSCGSQALEHRLSSCGAWA